MDQLRMLLERLPFNAFQVARYLISGGTATLANFTTLYVLTEFFGVWYLASSIVALAVGFVVSFLLQKFWAFKNKELERVHVQMTWHIMLSLTNVGINTVFLFVLVEHAHLWYMLAQFFSTGILACMNYFAYRYIIFPERTA